MSDGAWRLVLVMAGGAVGTGMRFLLAEALGERFAGPFPWPILVVNLLGCFAAGVLGALWAMRAPAPEVSGFLVVGVLGGFTTYSAFNHGVLGLERGGATGLAALYVLATVGGGLLAGTLGAWLGRSIR